jgi:tRNA (guanine37-N1)-methyltransferase
MTFDIITIFPDIFDPYFNVSIIGRAQKNKKIKIKIHNLRNYTSDKHKTVDDKPYGGGVGMVMKVEPIYKAIKSIAWTGHARSSTKRKKQKVILLSAKGKKFDQIMARKWSKLDNIILICGRYEGVDERVKKFVDEEISVGDYVLTGGEVPAMVVVDAVSRLIPGVLGKDESSRDESHSKKGWLEYPHYTRPAEFKYNNVGAGLAPAQRRTKKHSPAGRAGKTKTLKVPKVLLSGNHQEIKKWRQKKSKQQ